MKKLYTIMVVLAGLLGFTGCETDRDHNPTLLAPTTFVLNTPPYVSGVYDLRNTETILFTTSQPDYGFTASVNYQVQISMENNFQEYEELNTIYTSARIEANASDIAVAMTRLLEDEYDEDNFPEDKLFEVYVRLSATLAGANRDTIYSNIIELPQVKSYYALPAVELPTSMYLIGNVTGWDWATATAMVPDYANKEDKEKARFWAVQYLGQVESEGEMVNAEIKFSPTTDWNDAVGIQNSTIDAASIARAGITGDNDIVIGNPGWYLVIITVTLDGRDYAYEISFEEPNVYVIGNDGGATGKWGIYDEWKFSVPEKQDAYFVSPPFTGSGEVRLGVQLPGQGSGDVWQSEFMIVNEKIEYRGIGEQQEQVNVAANQRAYLNFTKGTGYFGD